MPWDALSGFETPARVTVADPVRRVISPISSLAKADRGERSTSIRMKKQSRYLYLLPWVEPNVSMLLFAMVFYLRDGS